jgi:hypothetical protein
MTDLRTAAQQALEALIQSADCSMANLRRDAIAALRAALEQPEQEPVAWGVDWGRNGDQACCTIIKQHADGVQEVVAVEYSPPRLEIKQKAECDGGTCGLGGYCDGCPNRPVAWQWLNTAHFRKKMPADAELRAWNPLYTHPPRREWRGLTDEEIDQMAGNTVDAWECARAIEAALKERNA